MEMPWLQTPTIDTMPAVNRRLLQYWLEQACHMMTLDPENNPLSSPIVQRLPDSDALCHALQCVSGGYEYYYEPSSINESLKERGKALRSIRQELQASMAVTVQTFVAVWMLGISATWLDSVHVFGKEHLLAARKILDQLLQQDDFTADRVFRPFIVGAYIWWDMACSLLVPAAEQIPLDTPEIHTAVISLRGEYCTLVSHATELFFYLGCLGRYCRALAELMVSDIEFEADMEQKLISWANAATEPTLNRLNETFRLHGLIMIHRLGSRSLLRKEGDQQEGYIRQCAMTIFQNISRIDIDNAAFKFVAIPLLSAAAELQESDGQLRRQTMAWFSAQYSINRAPPNKWAPLLLAELWTRTDAGERLTWLQLMLQKRWTLMMG